MGAVVIVDERSGVERGAPNPARLELALGITAVLGAALALHAASTIDLEHVGDFGLAASLPLTYWVALAALNGAFAVAVLHGRCRRRTMVMLLGALVITLFAVGAMVSSHPRGEPTWRHLGIIDHLVSGRPLDGNIDAYFNWPGFFSLGAFISRAAGSDVLVTAARWAPVWVNALWLLALSVPLRLLARDERRWWMALWIFCLGNWIDQDYFSPQAYAFFLYATIIGLALWAFGTTAESHEPGGIRRWMRWRGTVPGGRWLPSAGRSNAEQRAFALVAIVGLTVAMIVSHQLTPAIVIVSLGLLTIAGRLRLRRTAILVGIAMLAWLLTGASAYLSGHPVISSDALSAAADANVAHRLAGSEGHMVVVRERMILFAGLGVFTAIGLWSRYRARRHDRTIDVMAPVLLAAAPFLLVPANSYGGEMLLRAALFSLPFMAILTADAVPLPDPTSPRSRVRPVVRIAVLVALLQSVGTMWAGGAVFARYGNARFDTFTDAEVRAVEVMYAYAPDGGVIVSAAHPTPWRSERYASFRYATMQDLCEGAESPSACVHTVLSRIGNGKRGGMIVMLRSGEESLRMQGFMSAADVESVKAILAASPGVRVVLDNAEGRIYEVAPR
jgi:hypothetical protein